MGALVATCHALFTAQGFAEGRGRAGLEEELLCRLRFLHDLAVLEAARPCVTLRMQHTPVERVAGTEEGGVAGVPRAGAARRPPAAAAAPASAAAPQGYSQRVCTLLAERDFQGAVEAAHGAVGADWGFPDVAVEEWLFRDRVTT
jgi:hypothetical protein